MATFIMMDGLAGHPITTFGELRQRLQMNGHTVVVVDIVGILSHQDRITRIAKVYRDVVRTHPTERIFLVGQSAGGSAVRIASEQIGKDRNLAGVIMLSPAMPFGIWYPTATLLRIMCGRVLELLFGKNAELHLTPEEHLDLICPVLEHAGKAAVAFRPGVPLKEARKLAFFPDRLGVCQVPILHIHGNKDAWIRAKAQATLSAILKRKGADIETYSMPEAGHITLLSPGKESVIDIIEDWSNRKSLHRFGKPS